MRASRVFAAILCSGVLAVAVPAAAQTPTPAAPVVASAPVAATSGVDTLARVRFIPATVTGVDGNPTGGGSLSGVEPKPFFSLVKVPLIGGTAASLTPGTVAVDADTARANAWAVGDSISVFYPQVGAVE
mgnify:CR=1 FL=1